MLSVEARPGGAATVTIPAAYEDVLARLFHRTVTVAALCTSLPANVYGSSRIVHGTTTQAVPLLTETSGPQHLLFIENDDVHRTNIGIVSESGGSAEVLVYDAAGTEVERSRLSTSGGVAQAALRSRLTNGRAVVRFDTGTGSAYASVIDRGTGDATLIEPIGWRPLVP